MAFDAGSHAFPAAFDPVDFFTGRTSGWGAVRSFTGRVARRCRIVTQSSEAAEFGALHFDEIYAFDGGLPDDRMRWAVVRDARGRLDATEESVTSPIISTLQGAQWRVRFKRRAMPPAGGPVLHYDARFSLVAPDLVMKTVAITLLGAPIATLNGFHRRLASPGG